ncbi:C-4 methylsterol oxidase [Musa troglodytarum]|uniref:aldehyde oxygenase (deformylating) n=1 Tax=Musa troglodytarum TaxID=320322 RepID=A0A9E7GH35_9LILI|nr:C-4 methylsterol oxidase [Musa troglodytarum]
MNRRGECSDACVPPWRSAPSAASDVDPLSSPTGIKWSQMSMLRRSRLDSPIITRVAQMMRATSVRIFSIFFGKASKRHHDRRRTVPYMGGTDRVFLLHLRLARPQSMASPLESCWLYLIAHFSEFQLATIGSFLIHESAFFLSGFPSIFLERSGLFSKYKIQKKRNTAEAHKKCISRLILYHVCVNLPVMLISYPAFRYMGLSSSLPLPNWTVIVSQIIFYFILEDFVFYWGHRILHTKWLYKHVHSIHHEHATPFGLTSEYAHPAEILFLGFATIVGPALTGPHLLTLWLWMVLRVLETVEVHSGYHFPWSPSNFLPLYGG